MDLDIVRKMFTGIGKFAGIVNPLPYILNAIVPTVADNAIGDGAWDSTKGKYLGTNMTGQERENAELNVQNQIRLAKELPEATVQGYERAGVNPAFALSGGHVGTPSNTSSISAGGSLSDLIALATLPAQLKLLNKENELKDIEKDKMQADANLTNANADKAVEETESLRISNEFMRQTFDARKEAINAENDLTRSKALEVYKNMEVADANIKKLLEEATTEDSKRALMKAQQLLSNANASQIYSLLPYQRLLMEAQTNKERALAILNMAQTAYQRRLISSGYVEAMCDQLLSSASASVSQSELHNVEKSIREVKDNLLHGDAFVNSFKTGFAPLDFISDNVCALGNDFISALVMIADNFPKIM